MFAFALWDGETRELSLARDRLGKKPLYYGWAGETFLFGSELKALRAHPALRREVDRAALAAYLRHGYVPAPQTIYTDIRKLPPGTLVEVCAERRGAAPEAYWSLAGVAQAGAADPFDGTVAEALDQLDALLRDAVALRMVADVPLGAFLSGGIDSSIVVALMQAQSADPVKTFTIGFEERGYDEAPAARQVAAPSAPTTPSCTSARRTRATLSRGCRRSTTSRSPTRRRSRPISCRSSRAATSRSASRATAATSCSAATGATSSPSACGSRIARVPAGLRPVAAGTASAAAAVADRVAAAPTGRATPLGDRLQRMSAMLRDDTPGELYERIASFWDPDDEVVIGARDGAANGGPGAMLGVDGPLLAGFMLADGLHYLPDDILTKVDRASMAVTLEVRNPLLDHRVVELACRLPLAVKVRAGEGKWPLRTLLRRYLPDQLVDRPKAGFDLPIAEWLRGPLRGWAEELLGERRLRDEGYLRPEPVRAKWEEHLSGRRNWQHQLWAVLMFEAWLDAQPA